MDKQTNIPVNTRTIGTPEGIYILYLEDYVHTFIRKILSDSSLQDMSAGDGQRAPQQEIALFGESIEENGRYRIVISGAALLDSGSEKIQQLNNTYFPSCAYIGNAGVSLNKDSRLRLELALRNTKVILDDFYIYYDQNEEMQNYLVEWNTTKGHLSPAEHDTYTRSSVNDAAHISRIAQAYNREEAKVSFMWNVMNVLCLGFVVCVMVYGIISINNYNKMQNMQANIDYCLAFVAENTSFHIQAGTGESRTVPAIQQNVQAENEMINTDTDAAREEISTAMEQPVQEQTQQPETLQSEMLQSEALQPAVSSTRPAQDTVSQTVAEPDATAPQYYIVRKGDTLRTICYNIYGDYSRVDEICRWNNIDNPDNILYGQKLLLP